MYQYQKSHITKKISMDPSEFPFDIEAYKRQSEIEERYIVKQFRERRNQIGDRVPFLHLAKEHELYSSGKSGRFNLMSEWLAVRDQPRYGSQVGGNTGSESNGSKRAHESDASDSNSVGSSARSLWRDAAKKKGKKKSKGAALESINDEWNEFKQYKEKELERLDKIAMRQEEATQLLKESNEDKKMKMFMKLSSKENLDDRRKELLEKLGRDMFGN